MNCGIWINDQKAGEWNYAHSTFEFDISDLVKKGQNNMLVIVVYQNPNSHWYLGAGIFRDVLYINTPKTYIISDGVYFNAVPQNYII